MPQVDLETLVCGLGSDGRVSCDPDPEPEPDPNLPPESVTLPIDHSAVAAWLEASAVYDRDDSTKESTNPKSNNANSSGGGGNSNNNPKNTRSNSQRYASGGTNLKAEGPIIGLPARIRHVTCSVSRRPPSTTSRIFPRKSRGKGKSVPEAEPTSPKVSCFGKVLSDRERIPKPDDFADLDDSKKKKKKKGLWSVLAAILLCSGGGGRKEEEEAEATSGKLTYNEKKKTPVVEVVPTEVAAPGLGGMKRFASGRRPASWGGEGDVDAEAESEGFLWGRRSVGTIEEGRRD